MSTLAEEEEVASLVRFIFTTVEYFSVYNSTTLIDLLDFPSAKNAQFS